MAYSFFPSPTHGVQTATSFLFSPTAGKPPIALPAAEMLGQARSNGGSPSARSSIQGPRKLYRHMRLGSSDMNKLLSKAAKLEAHIMKEPVDVKAYQKKWYAEKKVIGSREDDNKHTISLPVIAQPKLPSSRRPQMESRRDSRYMSPVAIESPKAPQIVFTCPDSQSPVPSHKETHFTLPSARPIRRKQSEQELEKILALCDTEETHRKVLQEDLNKEMKARGKGRSTSLDTNRL